MRHLKQHILTCVTVVLLLTACKTNKNTFVHRGYHNLTARYNGYYYAMENIKEGEEKIRLGYKFDYDRLLPVFLVPTNENAKATFPEFDKAIKKSSNCIQRHTIKDKHGNEITTAGKWIDNNWNVIGISRFYKREFFSGIEAFEYVIRSYKSKDKHKALIWLAKSYSEIGSITQTEAIIGLLKDEPKISKYAKRQLPALRADYYIKRGMYKEAQEALIIAMKGGDDKGKNPISKYWMKLTARPPKVTRSRYAFILAQLEEEKKSNKKAIQYYKKTIDLKPNYELVFQAKMKMSRLVDISNAAKTKRELLKMINDVKNTEYLDIIYYTLGEISEKEKKQEEAISYYKLSVQNSTQNPKQKALSYLKLGEINFENADYTASGAYYDSTMMSLPKDYKDYEFISKRKTTLETLVSYIRTIQREDSLQKVAKMSESDRTRYIEKMIEKIEAEEERKKEEMELMAAQNANPTINAGLPNNGLPTMSTGTKGDWYFYNQTTLSFGLNDFIKKWGNRKLEDNWRRSQKTFMLDENVSSKDSLTDELTVDGTKPKAIKDKKNVEYYLADLPLTDSLMKKSNIKIVDAYYNLASTYKEELNNNKKAIHTFEELNNRFPNNKYKLSTYFQLYRIYSSVKNQSQADFYKNKLLNDYPNSEYAQIIKNPNYVSDKAAQKGEVELFYTETYNEYSSGNYVLALAKSTESETKFGKNDFAPKFAFIKALCKGKLKGIDSLESSLKQIQIFYPKDDVSKQAQNYLEVIYNMKHPSEATATNEGTIPLNTDTFSLNLNVPHFVIAVFPDNSEVSEMFKSNLASFNNNFYANKKLETTNSLFGATSQILIIKTFDQAQEALLYIDNLKKDKSVFSGKVKLEEFTIMTISLDNMPKLFKKKQVSYYQPFYDDHYKLN